MMTFSAVSAEADWATTQAGEIGLVDTAPVGAANFRTGTQGATLVYPGVAGQALGDVRLLLPNTFQNGDTIDLTVFDRTATATGPGGINADTAHALGFTAAPTVTVNSTPLVAATSIGPNSDTAGNTENTPVAATAGEATTAPVFAASVVASSRANGLATDIIRLRINGTQATGTVLSGDFAPEWEVTLSGLKATLGASVSPGELRVVPFAYNGLPSTTPTVGTDLFQGNLNDDPATLGFDPVINIYTVPAYVAPVTFNIGAPNNIVGDGTTQRVGDITIAETNNYSLQDGTYTLAVDGATVMNTAAAPITVTGTGFTAPGETVVKAGAVDDIQFTIAGALQTTKVSIKLSGLLLSTGTQGPITYTLTGGSIGNTTGSHQFLVQAGTSRQIPEGFSPPLPPPLPGSVSGIGGVRSDLLFGTPTGRCDFQTAVNQCDIAAPELTVNSFASDVVHRIGGSDRYETAAKIAYNNGANDYIVLASGQNFPDALSSGYLANQVGGGSIVLTRTNALPVVTATAMRELGTRTVFIIGGTGAISAGVEAQLKATPQYYFGGRETIGQGKLNVVRLGGIDRYATNKAVNQYAAAMWRNDNPVGRTAITYGESSKLTALVATGENFPDALAGGPATAGTRSSDRGNLPLILTRTGSLTVDAAAQLNNLGIQQAVVLGGTGAVSAAVATSITGMGIVIDRLGGVDRYATAALIADFETAAANPTATTDGGLGFDRVCTPTTQNGDGCHERAYLATGVVYADALAGATLAGGSGSPILLTAPTTLSTPTQVWLSAHADAYSSVVAFGLAGAVSNAVLDAANAAIAGG